jgi:hypothetical protein
MGSIPLGQRSRAFVSTLWARALGLYLFRLRHDWPESYSWKANELTRLKTLLPQFTGNKL